VQTVDDELGIPVVTAAIATNYEILKALGHQPSITGAGHLLSEKPTFAVAGTKHKELLNHGRRTTHS